MDRCNCHAQSEMCEIDTSRMKGRKVGITMIYKDLDGTAVGVEKGRESFLI